MFTGIIQATAHLERREPSGAGARLTIATPRPLARLALGESVAVNGACLTVVRRAGARFMADVSPETLARTTLGRLPLGRRLNVERALKLGDRLGGHIVQGHVDGVGRTRGAADSLTWFDAPEDVVRYCVVKGSIAVDGTSLTVAALDDEGFAVALVPHTLAATTLGALAPGDAVNLEVDVLAKYVERLVTK